MHPFSSGGGKRESTVAWGKGRREEERERVGASVRPPVAVMLDEIPDEDVLPPRVVCCTSCSLVHALSIITFSIYFSFCQLVFRYVSLHLPPPSFSRFPSFPSFLLVLSSTSGHFPLPGAFRLALPSPSESGRLRQKRRRGSAGRLRDALACPPRRTLSLSRFFFCVRFL